MHQKADDKLIRLLKNQKTTLQNLSETLKISIDDCRKYLSALGERGIEIISEKHGKTEEFYIRTIPKKETGLKDYSLNKDSEGWYKFGIVSDTHLNSKYSAVKQLHKIYDDFESENIQLVLHAGDLTEGNGRVYSGQIYELQEVGYENILDKTIKDYPKRENIKTAIISGNHDLSFWKENGSDIVKQVADKRDDIDYLGQVSANLKVQGLYVHLVHPDGNMPYSRSYKMQKMIEQMYQKPDILIRGHLHVAMYIPYLGVQGIEAGCFQKQTPYLERKGLYPELGGWMVKFKFNEKGKLDEFLPIWVAK